MRRSRTSFRTLLAMLAKAIETIEPRTQPLTNAPSPRRLVFALLALWRREADFDDLLRPIHEEADRTMLVMCGFLQLVCLTMAPLRGTWGAVLMIGSGTLALSWLLVRLHPGELLTRLYMGGAFMAYTGLIIHQMASLEGIFSVFGLIGYLLFYRDWRTVIVAAVFIFLYLMALGYAQVLGAPVYVFVNGAYWQNFGMLVACFLPFIVMMIYLAIALRRQGADGERVRKLAEEILAGDITRREEAVALPKHSDLLCLVVGIRNRLMELVYLMPIPVAVVRMDQQILVNVNNRWEGLFDQSADYWVGQPMSGLACWTAQGQWAAILEHFENSHALTLDNHELTLQRPDGKRLLASISARFHKEGRPPMLIIAVEDITYRRSTEDTLRRLAYQDLLSGLANRANLYEALLPRLERVHAGDASLALLLMDLDGFKVVNDTLGHDAGDEVLKVVGQRLLALKRGADVVARLGGDEFCVVMDDCDDTTKAGAVAQRIIESISKPMRLPSGQWCTVGMSVGLVIAGSDATNLEELFKQADVAMYEAKHAGKGCWRA